MMWLDKTARTVRLPMSGLAWSARLAAASLVVACAATNAPPPAPAEAGGGAGGADAGPHGTGGGPTDLPTPDQDRDDFATPILDANAPADAPMLFARPDVGANGPCLFEPELGSLFPRNWLRPRFRFQASGDQNLFEIKLTIPHQKSPLVVYTRNPSWTMSKEAWQILTQYAVGPIEVSVRGATYDGTTLTDGPVLGSKGTIEIAPVIAPGAVVYWTSSDGTVLKGFKIGDETVQDVLRPQQNGSACVACHASTPDGQFVGFASRPDGPIDGLSDSVGVRSVDGAATQPAFISAAAAALLARPAQTLPVFSRSHWRAGDRVQVSELLIQDRYELIWTDLETASQEEGVGWGVLARNGDTKESALPAFSHDGTRLAYVSGTHPDSAAIVFDGDIYTIPYADRRGGDATPLPGASDAHLNEYYPVFSPDDRLLAFNRASAGSTSYNQAAAEVFVIPAEGGQPTRLKANDPPACIGRTSPGVTNSWPRWAPEKATVNGKDYYFIVFSSTRGPESASPQLYITPVVVSGDTITTYAALYFWSQPETENNHTPAWDSFELPVPN